MQLFSLQSWPLPPASAFRRSFKDLLNSNWPYPFQICFCLSVAFSFTFMVYFLAPLSFYDFILTPILWAATCCHCLHNTSKLLSWTTLSRPNWTKLEVSPSYRNQVWAGTFPACQSLRSNQAGFVDDQAVLKFDLVHSGSSCLLPWQACGGN